MKLHDYQVVASDFLRKQDRAALFLDMGLGKTAAALSALEPRHLPALVVAPKRVAASVWPAEQRLWRPDLSLALAAGEPATRRAALDSGADITVIGRDNLKDVLTDHPFRTLIIDELSGFKNRASVRWKMARRIEQDIPYVWGLTGTPNPNGYMDLWAQVALLDHGARLGKNITTYRSRFFRPGRQLRNGTIIEWILRPNAEDRINELIADCCLSMKTDGRIELPAVTYNTIAVELPPAVRKVYRKITDDLVVDLRALFEDGEVHSARDAAVLTNKLSQISAGFLFSDDADIRDGAYTPLHEEKVNAVAEVVEGTGSPVLVFYRYRPELEMLRKALPQGVAITDKAYQQQDWDAGKIPVLFAHPASAGHGLNLQHGGHTIVWTSLPWPLEEWEQANKRLVRQGQRHPVVIHSIMANKTVDYLIAARLEDKAAVQESLLAYLESPV